MTMQSTMLTRVESYLAERRHLGFKLDRSGSQMLSFARFADANGPNGPLDSRIILDWARGQAANSDPVTWAQRVNVLQPFARYLATIEPGTCFPENSPFGSSKRRLAPHIFTSQELRSLVADARQVQRVRAAGPLMLPPLIGLLASTGLRISEALGLRMGDVDLDTAQITVRFAKFGRKRLVALHPSSVTALGQFIAEQRGAFRCGASDPFFKDELTGEALAYREVLRGWKQLTLRLGIVPRGEHSSVRLHDLRHTFICRRLLEWQAHGTDIDGAMLMLSTYVGHVNLRDTYWYIEAVPELMALAGDRFEKLNNKVGDGDHG
jgi:integrase/recombinase XerD